jgi:hypothetical protein
MMAWACDPSYMGGISRRVKAKTLPKKIAKAKRLVLWLKWYSPCIQTPVPQKKKRSYIY